MRSLRLAVVALAAAAALVGCADKSATPEVPPTPSSSPSALPTPVPLGAEGMDVRYLDEDGQTRTLRVEDFPR